MTWRERRIVTILTTIVLILAAALLIVLGIRFREWRDSGNSDAGSTAAGIVTDSGEYTALTYSNGSATLSFTRDDAGVWHWTADEAFPLDDMVIRQILDLLANWTPQQTLTEEAALDGSGLDESTASLTATTADGKTTSVLFGKTTTDGNSHYVRLNGDLSTVYIIAGTLYELMSTPIYDMCRLPELPVLAETSMRSITIQGAAGEDGTEGPVTVLTAAAADGVVSWRSSGANVTDDPTVRSLLEDLTAPKVAKCVDYNPSEEAVEICGLNAPEATVDIAYTTESGTDGELSFSVGARLPDKSGRYVQLKGESTIYLMETDMLDPLMRVAADGLEG